MFIVVDVVVVVVAGDVDLLLLQVFFAPEQRKKCTILSTSQLPKDVRNHDVVLATCAYSNVRLLM